MTLLLAGNDGMVKPAGLPGIVKKLAIAVAGAVVTSGQAAPPAGVQLNGPAVHDRPALGASRTTASDASDGPALLATMV